MMIKQETFSNQQISLHFRNSLKYLECWKSKVHLNCYWIEFNWSIWSVIHDWRKYFESCSSPGKNQLEILFNLLVVTGRKVIGDDWLRIIIIEVRLIWIYSIFFSNLIYIHNIKILRLSVFVFKFSMQQREINDCLLKQYLMRKNC